MSDKPGAVRWLRFGTTLVVLAAVLTLLAPASRALAVLWLDTALTTFTHGFLIAAVSTWLLYRASVVPDFAGAHDKWKPLLAVAMLAGVLLWELCYRAGIQLGFIMLLPPLMWGAVYLVQGAGVARGAAFPIAYLYFAIPVWEYLNGIAQAATVVAVRFLLRLTHIPAFVSGNFVQIPRGIFEIEGGCSGLHFLIVALAVAALMGELRHDGWRLRLRWLVAALVLAVLTNWFRVYSIIVVGHLSNMQHYLVRVSHYGYGWALFAIALCALFLLERRAPPGRKELPMSDVPEARVKIDVPWTLVAALCAVLPWTFNAVINARTTADAAQPTLLASLQPPAGWQSVSGQSDWQPVQIGADRIERRRFRRDGMEVEMLVASYAQLAQGRELGGFDNQPGGNAAVVEVTRRAIANRLIAEQRLEAADGESLVWIEYRVDGRSFASATYAQLWYSWRVLRDLRSPPSGVLLWRAACASGCDAARENLNRFVSESGDRG